MYYLTERSVMANDMNTVFAETADPFTSQSMVNESVDEEKEAVFSHVDLWHLQKNMKTIHVTDRFPRTWEGLW